MSMKKWMYVIGVMIIILVAILVGYYLFQNSSPKQEPRMQAESKNTVQEQNILKDNMIVNEISVSSVEKEKISPKATLVLEKYYEECDHTIKEYVKIPEEYVNKTKEELEELQEDWEVQEFSSSRVVLRKRMNSTCNEHFVIREKEGIIAVYQVKDNNEEVLKEETGITVEYLTENDKLRLEEGIRIYGEEELNSTLEDYE